MPSPRISPEIRAQAVARVLAGEKLSDVAQALGVSLESVSRWATMDAQDVPPLKTPPPPDYIAQYNHAMAGAMVAVLGMVAAQARFLSNPCDLPGWTPDDIRAGWRDTMRAYETVFNVDQRIGGGVSPDVPSAPELDALLVPDLVDDDGPA